MPFALVAESDGKVCGNLLVIDNDEPARPDLSLWVAAVWVDEAAGPRGIARAMMDEAARRCRTLGIRRLYLVSRRALQGFYVARGWQVMEEGVGKHDQTLYTQELD